MKPNLYVLWRGPLSSCNYDCVYCPFAKHRSSAEELAADRLALERFVGWIRDESRYRIQLLFTPWGEALTRPWYREALLELSHLPQVRRVAIQTNLSGSTAWMADADRETLALWVTYHPTQVRYERFLARRRELDELGVRHSVGIVGLEENIEHATCLRRDLPEHIYLWVNAYKSDGPDYYEAAQVAQLSQLDPLFSLNNVRHPSLGRPCRAGADAISVDGDGDVRRCHFVPEILGNLYRDDVASLLRERSCPQSTCGCYIGYVHLEHVGARERYEDGVMERIPTGWSSTTP